MRVTKHHQRENTFCKTLASLLCMNVMLSVDKERTEKGKEKKVHPSLKFVSD